MTVNESVEDHLTTILAVQSAAITSALSPEIECLQELEAEEDYTKKEINAPPIDIFLNPERAPEIDIITSKMSSAAKSYFESVDMTRLYPELFRLLWQSTLPCFPSQDVEDSMLRSCRLGDLEVPCEKIFTRVATDSGKASK